VPSKYSSSAPRRGEQPLLPLVRQPTLILAGDDDPICSRLGRPKGEPGPRYSLALLAARLRSCLAASRVVVGVPGR
jgi:hypothetical protein